ncbi:MAG: cyclopropane-fatty-acyl-phospholipid synthase family protein [Pseudomonadota bacterium]
MKRVLTYILRKIMHSGDLMMTFADGQQVRFGDGTGKLVHFRFVTKEAERAVALNPTLKLGECYMDGDLVIDQGDMYDLLEIILRNDYERWGEKDAFMHIFERLRRIPAHFLQWNSLRRSRSNVQHHYDLSGELYDLFLDPDRQYSCAYFEDESMELEQAQMAKKRLIASKLYIDRENLRILDIGSGWGGMGLHLARHFNAKVTGVTLSDEQFKVSNQRAREDGFAGQVEFKLLDYRNLEQTFDRIVSVGMFEHVGRRHYSDYFNKCAKMLDRDGVMLLHTIGQSDPPSATNPFLKKHIFPGGYVPALSEVLPAIERSGLVVTDIEILRHHYAKTLRAWRTNFLAHWEKAKELYDERFCRMWEFYLAASEASFLYQDMVVFQIQLAHRPDAVPLTRDYISQGEQAPHRARKASASAKKKRAATEKQNRSV